MNTGGSGSSGGYVEPSVGLKVARIYKIVDIGTQEDEYKGVKKKTRNVVIWWELSQKMEDGKPFSTFLEYNQDMSKTLNKLRKHIESWTGKDMTPEIIKAFDFKKFLLGKCMLVNLVKKESGRVKVSNLMARPPEIVKPEFVNPLVYFDLDEKPFDEATFAALPKWVHDKITISPEYRRLRGEVLPEDAHHDSHANDELPPVDDDIPF